MTDSPNPANVAPSSKVMRAVAAANE